MNIGQVAKESGVSAKMIRYYEGVELIGSARRSGSGYRIYSGEDVQVLRFIRRARDLGFKVEDIRDLLKLWRDRGRKSAQVKKVTLGHIGELKRKIVELQDMVSTLESLVDRCAGDQESFCPIIEKLVIGKDHATFATPPKFNTASNRTAKKG